MTQEKTNNRNKMAIRCPICNKQSFIDITLLRSWILKEGIQIGRDEMRKEWVEYLKVILQEYELKLYLRRMIDDKIKELQSKGDKK